MGPTPRILKADDFGDFEPELKRAFRKAFQFAWDLGPESIEEQARRRAFAAAVWATRSPHEVAPERCRELIDKIYELEYELCNYLWPGDGLRDALASISAAMSVVGDKLFRLPAAAFAQTGGNALPSIAGIRKGWRVVEAKVRADLDAIPQISADDEIMRLRAVGVRTRSRTCFITELLGTVSSTTKNAVNNAARMKDLEEIAASLREISHRLEVFCETCTPPRSEEMPFRAYFERVVESLPVQCSFAVVRGKLAPDCEVPLMALNKTRELSEHRAGVLEWLCTRDPAFHPLLPSSARRDHLAPTITGGRGHSNWVLHGLTAALVLLGLVDEARDSPQSTSKNLFKATVKRVERWIADQAARGRFYVNATKAEQAPAISRGMPLIDRYMVKGRV